MLCLSFSAPGEELGGSGSDSFVPRADVQIAYVTVQPTACAVDQYILLTSSEASRFAAFDLTVEEAGPLAGAVLMVWAVAFGIRMVIRALRDTDSPTVSGD